MSASEMADGIPRMPDTPDSDPQLLAAARRVLGASGFRVREARLPEPVDVPWLLAENEYFVIAVGAGHALADIRMIESYVAAALGDLLAETDLGAKRWDAYVVLLARTDAEERGRADVLEIEYNTRSLRRMVSLGVTEAAVEEALATFVALPKPPAGGLPSAYEELVEQLVVHGIERAEAQDVVATYRREGELDNG